MKLAVFGDYHKVKGLALPLVAYFDGESHAQQRQFF